MALEGNVGMEAVELACELVGMAGFGDLARIKGFVGIRSLSRDHQSFQPLLDAQFISIHEMCLLCGASLFKRYCRLAKNERFV
jgi:hypothetical protein